MPEDEMSPREAARVLRVSLTTIRRYVDKGYLHPRILPSGYHRYGRAEVLALAETTRRLQEPEAMA